MDLMEILASMIADEGLSVACVVGRDGLLIDGQSADAHVDLEAIGALAVKSVIGLEHLERTLSTGPASRLRLRFERYELLIEPMTETDILVAGVSSATESERLLNAVARYRSNLRQSLGDL